MLRYIAALSLQRSSLGLHYTIHATDVTQPTGIYVESPEQACGLLLPTEIHRLEDGGDLSLLAFMRRVDQACRAAKGGSIGIANSKPSRDDVDQGTISALNAPLTVRIEEAVIYPKEALHFSAAWGMSVEERRDDSTSDEWLNPAPLALSHGLVINHDQQQRGREIDEALGEVRDIWALTCEDEDERRLASWRIAKRFDPVNEVGFVEYTEWPLLFSLEQ
jgi:hypothetical protein